MRRLLIAAAVLVVALVLAACGGNDSSEDSGNSTTADGTDTETPEGGSVTRAEFIEMADAICSANTEPQDALRADLDAATNPEEAAVVYDELAALSEQAVAEVLALPRPEGDEATIEELAAAQTQGAALVRDLATAIRANDQAAGEDLIAQLGALTAEADAADRAFGFQVC